LVAVLHTEGDPASVVMAAGGVIAGLVGGLVATRYLRSTLYGVSRLDPSVYAAEASIALLAAIPAPQCPRAARAGSIP